MKLMKNISTAFLVSATTIGLGLSGCAGRAGVKGERAVLDTADQRDLAPAWVLGTKTYWKGDGGAHLFKAQSSVRGDERVSACYTLARLNAQEAVASEIFAQFSSITSHATQGTLEGAPDILQQSRNSETKGTIQGLRFIEDYHQRYLVNGVERVDCFVMAELPDSDYRRIRANFLGSESREVPELKKAIEEKHIDLFKKAKPADREVRAVEQGTGLADPEPASIGASVKNEKKDDLIPGPIAGSEAIGLERAVKGPPGTQ